MTDQAEVLPTHLEVCQIAFDSLLEIIGPEDLHAVLDGISLPVEIVKEDACVSSEPVQTAWTTLQSQLYSLFGTAGAAGIAIRTGEVIFKNFYRQYGTATFLDTRDFSMLPKPARIRRGLEGLASYQEKYVTGTHVIIDHDADNWYWKMDCDAGSSDCQTVQTLLAKIMWGMVIEFITWTAGGKKYSVHEAGWQDGDLKQRVIVIRKKVLD